MPLETRSLIKSDIDTRHRQTSISVHKLLAMYGISRSTFYGWNLQVGTPSKRYNPLSVLEEEEQEIVKYRLLHRDVGYRKLCWMMVDEGIVALSESAVFKVLAKHDLLGPFPSKTSEALDEYQHKPSSVHEHWHTDLAYIKIQGVFYFLILLLDGYSRYILGWELLTNMTSLSVQDFIATVRGKYKDCSPKLIHDNGSAFISKDFKALLSRLDIQSVHTRRNHPETNGKIERLNGTVRQESLRVNPPTSFAEAEATIKNFVEFYNNRRLHAGIRYLRPSDMFSGIHQQILDQRKQKLQFSRLARSIKNKHLMEVKLSTIYN
jgi:transposase InsO family protein